MHARSRFAALAAACFLSACGHGASAPAPGASAFVPAAQRTAAPPPPWTNGQRSTIHALLANDLAVPVLARAGGIEILGADGTELYAQRPAMPMIPASTIKTIVAATSLYTLGPGARLSTTLETLQQPDGDGRIDQLFLVGTGDPLFSSDDLRGGVGALHRAGVRAIDGDVVVDATAFDGPELNPFWSAEDETYGYAAGTSAISLDQDTAEFVITPSQVGAPAEVRVEPRNPSVHVQGSIETAYSTSLHIDRAPADNTFTLSGQIAAGEAQQFWQPVIDVPGYVGGALLAMLQQRGIDVSGHVREGVAPIAAQTLWEHLSPAMRQLVRQMCLESNNHFAEQLLRVVGGERGRGTVAAGARVERAFLTRRGVSVTGLHISDGSGLAAADRVSPRTFAQLLVSIGDDPPGRAFVAALPLVGVEGTVRHHTLNAAAGRARAKSGHIGEVSGLVGYVLSRHHGRIAFAFLVNDPAAWDDAIDDAEDRALDDLSRM